MTMPTIHRTFATTAMCLAAAGLSSCSFFASPLTCNLSELVAPPDARVAMVDHRFPHRPAGHPDAWGGVVKTGTWGSSSEIYLYQLNGIYYRKRTIQYAKAHRPIIRRADRPDSYAYPLTYQQRDEQFTFDSSIPEEVWMQPVDITGEAEEYNKLCCIPASQFDFSKARRTARYGHIQEPLCDLPIKDKPGTSSLWRTVTGVPLAAVDMAATATLCVAECCAAVLVLPAYPFHIFIEQQQQNPYHVEDDELPAWKK